MRVSTAVLLLASTVQAHYRFSKLVLNGTPEATEWTTIRQTKNYQSNFGVTDVAAADMRCFQNRAGTGTASVAAGSVLGFVANAQVSHFGPVQFYMAKVPDEGADVDSWEAAGNVWFKVGSISAVQGGNGGNGVALGSGTETWPAYKKSIVDFTIPTAVPTGTYLVRVESIALHQAQNVGGAQIYLSCAQVNITHGGKGTPGPLVAFPGAYKSTDPGLRWSYYPVVTSYTAPGPAVWTG
ncbi:lytic polysaccharide monooxygenase [Pleomassaria siparia CBS 279.74]|uniref:lytic cellulose monooxygenase (C4-dehydrogenating) n=1 Tax=Pleomassaria siparia CBS 279.74 TaxID=1314801 RepID=A0A6G1KBC1_9PLEO|nr:lytic polysaccharide monooxygenase [Pleomassaria siparia CBS 279.74]